MCGFAGFVMKGGLQGDAHACLEVMTNAIAHRGPDDAGFWLDREAGVAFGHRRLAVIDLSPAGNQPMRSSSGRYVVAYNGEVYNYRELRARLEQEGRAPQWVGRSDTEVLLACIDAWGLRAALNEANGMFAFALWDTHERQLVLARDRVGEKPLYYGQQGARLFFASELKAIKAHPLFAAAIDHVALSDFMRFGYVPAPRSIWESIAKLPPGHLITLRPDDANLPEPEPYWHLERIAAAGASAPNSDSPALVDELNDLLVDSVRLRMEADVPLGSFLSGGIDSSLITALMQTQSSRPVKTFSIGFAEREHDESEFARAVAQHLGTEHHEMRITPLEAQSVLPQLPQIWDEPFADASSIPTYLVNALARQHVTVALSGDGGDELFAGYNRHVVGGRIWRNAERLPLIVRRSVGAALGAPVAGRAARRLSRLTGVGSRVADLTDRLSKVGAVFGALDESDAYSRMISKWAPAETPVIDARQEREQLDASGFDDFRNAMLFLDATTYLPDDILAKVDRAGMAVSLEARVPFLDHRVIELAWRIPLSAKIKEGRGKHILRKVLYRYVPPHLVDRPKAGFGIPLNDWLTGSLRAWAEHLLDPSKLQSQGYLDAIAVASTWDRFLNGDKALFGKIWCVLMFQSWLEHQHLQPAVDLGVAA